MGFRSEIKSLFQAVFKAQEEHRWSLEERQEEIMLQWMRVRWEEWMLEWDLVVAAVNMQSARMAGEKAAVEIRKWWYSVSVSFPFPQNLELT